MITTLSLLRAMGDAHRSLEHLTAGFERYPSLVNVRVREKNHQRYRSVCALAQDVEAKLGDEGPFTIALLYGTESLARG